ncbi:MAG TPA: benzoylformate decarboxylase [Pseudonocardiaceae bacterium]|jgi:benzoylformate decarboxylase|nr:benzoylformate decarboxylase [Pseudonocardiaceae bacterium]
MAEQGRSTVREVTRELMRGLGLTTVFGNPGSTELGFLDEWPDDFRYVLGLQELCVLSMADGYAQYTGNAAMVSLHSVGGVGHAMGGIATAFRNHTPLVILTGQQSRELLTGEPFLGSVDATEFPKPYVKFAVEPMRARDVPAAILRAYQVATQAPYGPTLVSVPGDDWGQPADPIVLRPRSSGYAPDPRLLAELAEALRNSRRPALVVGGSVDADGAAAEVVTLAEKLNAHVWTSPMSGRCSFPEEHPLFAGFLPPAKVRITAALADYDLVVVLGAPAFLQHVVIDEQSVALPPLYLLGDDDSAHAWAPEGISVRSTVRLGVTALLAELGPTDRPAPAPRARAAKPEASEPMTGPYVLSVLSELLPDDAILVEEIPSNRGDLHEYLPIRHAGGFLTGQSGVLGFSLSAAVGVSLAQPDRPVVALVGDGSSMYSIQGLWTAAREHTPVTFVVLDNGQYGALRNHAHDFGMSKTPGTELGGIDFRALAISLGCDAEYVQTPAQLAPTLEAALASDRPTLVHVRIGGKLREMY